MSENTATIIKAIREANGVVLVPPHIPNPGHPRSYVLQPESHDNLPIKHVLVFEGRNDISGVFSCPSYKKIIGEKTSAFNGVVWSTRQITLVDNIPTFEWRSHTRVQAVDGDVEKMDLDAIRDLIMNHIWSLSKSPHVFDPFSSMGEATSISLVEL